MAKEKQDQQPLEGTHNTPQTQTTPPTIRPPHVHLRHEWDDRVSHQRVHNSQMAELGFLYINNQGIQFEGHQPMDYMHDSYAHTTGKPSEPDESGNDDDDQCEGRDCKGNLTIEHNAQILARGIQSILDKYNPAEGCIPCKGDPKRKL